MWLTRRKRRGDEREKLATDVSSRYITREKLVRAVSHGTIYENIREVIAVDYDLNNIQYVDPNTLRENEKQDLYCGPVTQEKFDFLKGRIAANGIDQPLKVQAKTNVILGGHTRWKVALALQMPAVPVIYLDVDDETAESILAEDNKVGKTDEKDLIKLLHWLQRATEMYGVNHGQHLSDYHGKASLSEIAASIGVSRNTASRILRLDKLDARLQAVVSKRQMGLEPALAIAVLTPDQQTAFYEAIAKDLEKDGYRVSLRMAEAYRDACRGSKQGKTTDGEDGDEHWIDEVRDDESPQEESNVNRMALRQEAWPTESIPTRSALNPQDVEKAMSDANEKYGQLGPVKDVPTAVDEQTKGLMQRLYETSAGVADGNLVVSNSMREELDRQLRHIEAMEFKLPSYFSAVCMNVPDDVLQRLELLEGVLERFADKVHRMVALASIGEDAMLQFAHEGVEDRGEDADSDGTP